MKSIFHKIARFFWSWGFGKFVLWTVTLVILLYVEEDWRGARDWTATKAKWEAKGESFDFNKLIPPAVPDEQNLAALPLFKLEPGQPDDNGKTSLEPLALRRAMRTNLPGGKLPTMGKAQQGEVPELGEIRTSVAANFAEAFKNTTPPQSALAQFEALYPFITDLHAATATRPFCRFQEDYISQPAYGRSLSLISSQMALARILSMHAYLALSENQPQAALEDIKLVAMLNVAVGREPVLISGLVAGSLTVTNATMINQGLFMHAWNDQQLAEIQAALAPLDPLANYQLAMRGEFVGFSLPTITYLKTRRPDIKNFFSIGDQPPPLYATDSVFDLWANGWLDRNSCQMADALLESVTFADPQAHRMAVEPANRAAQRAGERRKQWSAYTPWNILYVLATPSLLNAPLQFARVQVRLDEVRMACGLERYRLAHGVYPKTLDALVPANLAAVPRDPVTGEPYHYSLRPDGTFLLYSVGWNLKDDGGVEVYSLTNPAPGDSVARHGDWVWPTLRLPPAK